MAKSYVPIGNYLVVVKEDGERLDKDITICARFTGIGYTHPLTTQEIGELAYEMNRIYHARTGKTPMHVTWYGEPKYVDLPVADVDALDCTRYWYHPESDCLFTTDGTHPESDGFVEEVTEERYAALLADREEAKRVAECVWCDGECTGDCL